MTVETHIGKATVGNMTDNVDDVEIESRSTDGATGQKETIYQNPDWNKELGIYKIIPEFKIALDMRAVWTLGKEIKCDEETKSIINNIQGWGKDTFRNILKNMIITRRLGKDAYSEIMWDNYEDIPLNLKVLDPSTIRQVYNAQGVLIRYEQTNKTSKDVIKFKPTDIFHLTNKRIADEVHGVADSEALAAIIEASNESLVDIRKVMHRYVKPMFKFILDTDDQAQIDALVAKFDNAVNKGENIYIPKGTVEQDLISVPSNSTLNPLPWREHLRNYFYQVVGIPQIIMGSSGEFTESTAKIAYLAFEQSVEDEQSDIEDQVWQQLQWKINLEFPASLRNELLTDEAKDGSNNLQGTAGAFQPSDTTAGVGQ